MARVKKSAAKRKAAGTSSRRKKFKVTPIKPKPRKAPPPSIADKITAGLDAFVRAIGGKG
jgi:hypothetical protein